MDKKKKDFKFIEFIKSFGVHSLMKNATQEEKNAVGAMYAKDNFNRYVLVAITLLITQIGCVIKDTLNDFYSRSGASYFNIAAQSILIACSALFLLYFYIQYKNISFSKFNEQTRSIFSIMIFISIMLFVWADFYRLTEISISIFAMFIYCAAPFYKHIKNILYFSAALIIIIVLYLYYFHNVPNTGLLYFYILGLVLFFIFGCYFRAYSIRGYFYECRTEKYTKMLKTLSITDSLTQVNNRHYMNMTYDSMLKNNDRSLTSLCIVMLDIDDFKAYNDNFSHIVGDECLVKVSSAILEVVTNENGNFFRYGGEEFVAFFENIDDENAVEICKSIIEKVRGLKIKSAVRDDAYLSVSIGCANVQFVDSPTLETVIDAADSQLHRAKQNGKDCISFCDKIF